jgi:hypothetical protein
MLEFRVQSRKEDGNQSADSSRRTGHATASQNVDIRDNKLMYESRK